MRSPWAKILPLLLLAAAAAACTPLGGATRAATSSVGCMRLAIGDLPTQRMQDKDKHCLATAAIARQCSVAEAYGAGVAKEIKDLLGPGDAQWGDLRADAQGVRCARSGPNAADIAQCCHLATAALKSDDSATP